MVLAGGLDGGGGRWCTFEDVTHGAGVGEDLQEVLWRGFAGFHLGWGRIWYVDVMAMAMAMAMGWLVGGWWCETQLFEV